MPLEASLAGPGLRCPPVHLFVVKSKQSCTYFLYKSTKGRRPLQNRNINICHGVHLDSWHCGTDIVEDVEDPDRSSLSLDKVANHLLTIIIDHHCSQKSMLAYFGYYQCHCVIVFLRLHLVIEELNLFPLDPLLRIFFLGRTKTIVIWIIWFKLELDHQYDHVAALTS